MAEMIKQADPDGTAESWAFFDDCLSRAKEFRKKGMSEEKMTQALQNTTKATPEFARYISRGILWPKVK